MPRGHPRTRERATDQICLALARISATVALLGPEPSNLATLRKQIEEAVEECRAALADIRDLAGRL